MSQVCVNEWQHKNRWPIHALATAAAGPRQLGLPRLGVTGPLVYAAAGFNEIGLWDVQYGRCHQVSCAGSANHIDNRLSFGAACQTGPGFEYILPFSNEVNPVNYLLVFLALTILHPVSFRCLGCNHSAWKLMFIFLFQPAAKISGPEAACSAALTRVTPLQSRFLRARPTQARTCCRAGHPMHQTTCQDSSVLRSLISMQKLGSRSAFALQLASCGVTLVCKAVFPSEAMHLNALVGILRTDEQEMPHNCWQ